MQLRQPFTSAARGHTICVVDEPGVVGQRSGCNGAVELGEARFRAGPHELQPWRVDGLEFGAGVMDSAGAHAAAEQEDSQVFY